MIIYYLEELCLQVKANQIERAYISEILRTFIENNATKSELMKRFITANNLQYNLKVEQKQIKISTNELITELEDDENSFVKEA